MKGEVVIMKRLGILIIALMSIMLVLRLFDENSTHYENATIITNVQNKNRVDNVIHQVGEDKNYSRIENMSYSMKQLEQMYPAGSKWNEYWEGGIECVGYALRLCYLYNNNVSTFTYGISYNVDEDLKPGTMVRYRLGAYDHSIFITHIDGQDVYYSDANYDLCGTIRWGMKTTKSEIARLITQQLNRPYDVRSHQYSTRGFILCYDKRIITYNISDCDISVTNVDRYKGQTEPIVTVKNDGYTLKEGVDYSYYFAYKGDNDGTIVIQGEGNYEGEVSKKYKVVRVDLGKCKASYTNTYEYTGKIINPENIVLTNQYGKIVEPSMYDISYSFYPVEPGKYKFEICASDDCDIYDGCLELEYVIEPKHISRCRIEYDRSVEFVGKECMPKVTIYNGDKELINGTDYSISYENNGDVGVGRIVITALSDRYVGRCIEEFQIYVKEHAITIH